MTMIPNQRHLFDIPEDVVYLNCAYNAPMLRASAERLVAGVQSKCHPWRRTPDNFFDDAEAFRSGAAALLGAPADRLAIVPSASYGLSAAARILEPHVPAGCEILIMEQEFPSNVFPWMRLAEATGARIVTVPAPSDFDWARAVLDRIGPRTAVVAAAQCHWTNGAWFDLARISDAARSVGAALALDATQSLGAVPFDFGRIRPDFCVAAGYKWLLCPYGLSLMYVDPKWHDARPLEESWLARTGAEDFANLADYSHSYQPGARRFDVGEKSVPTLLPGGIAAFQQLGTWGVAAVAEALRDLNRSVVEALSGFPLQPVPEALRSPNLLGFVATAALPDSFLPRLAEQRVYLSRRGSSLRFAPHLHVTANDLDRLQSAVSKALRG